jgi:hypothetical protein
VGIIGQTSDDNINAILLTTKPLLHDLDYDVKCTRNLVGLIKPTATNWVTWGPDTRNPNIAEDVTRVVQN